MNQQQTSGWLKVAANISAIPLREVGVVLASFGLAALPVGAAPSAPLRAGPAGSPLHPYGETLYLAQYVANPYISIFNPSALGPTRTNDGTIGGTLRAAIKYTWDFSEIAQAFETAGLTELLTATDPNQPDAIAYTVFLPTNQAVAALGDNIKSDPSKLAQILNYHIINGNVTASELESGRLIARSGQPIKVDVNGGELLLNDRVKIIKSYRTKNGVILFIDQVLLPPN
ncbi:MAG TPA: fasciclin domain-containing protein [Oscillatoriaceae cyanobacterium M33_DOE_052]|uniref:Fasciclin domain-containing protein n=1 Tax=Planktothricoides sp. SpSt-374 TaxID=2282167 RepID=A0A7C3ZJB5_9CYAN|nr:fasciclin domain-containing protein [Oscillatoriaceae cyanobacterium M33_DOE_052]